METPQTSLTVGDIEFFEHTTGTTFTALDEDNQPMGATLAALAGIGLYRAGRAPDRQTGVDMARDMPMMEAIDLMKSVLETAGE